MKIWVLAWHEEISNITTRSNSITIHKSQHIRIHGITETASEKEAIVVDKFVIISLG